MNKIVVTTTSFGKYDKKPLELLIGKGFEVVLNPYERVLKKDEVNKVCKGATGIIAGTEHLDADTLENLTKSTPSQPSVTSPQPFVVDSQSSLKVISRCGSGLDNIDINAANKLGIKVFNTPDAPTLAVAELTVGLMLDLLRKVSQMDRELREGQWQKRMGNLLSGKRVGVKGFGRIGKKVALLLKSFGCEIAYTDPFVEDKLLGLKRLSLEDLFGWADIITIHVGVRERLIGERELQLMKKGAWLINTSRGGVVDEPVLCEYLKNGHLSGAAIDVFEEEPYAGPLRELDNVIITPHVGSYAKESRVEMELQAVKNLLEGLGSHK
ncbi:MAG TPA: phosphoglycerate dehydrogenase [Candidatus Wunengus sp. YC65]|uniref:phosphoglycerate dehydrogenase n=1 Tax=Candidatus Wunengus sp. YC65 TaxID=3367701 RepID=UPI0040278859